MAKRLTDTEKWNDDWYISLDNDYRIIWQWLLDNCNHAGICKKSMKLLNLMCNTNISEEDLISSMCERVIPINNDWFIPKFLKFQYVGLHSDKPVIVSVRSELFKTDYYKLIPQSFGNDYLIIKDKDKDKDKDSEGGMGGDNKNSKNKINGKDFKVQREETFLNGITKRAKEHKSNGKAST